MAVHAMPTVAMAAIMVASMAVASAHAQSDDARAKALDDLGGMLEMVRSAGVGVSEPTAEQAAPFVSRMAALAAQSGAGHPADALDARAMAIMSEYALFALSRAESTPEADRASEFLSRLAEVSTRYAAAASAGGSTAAIGAERDALLAEFGLLFMSSGDADGPQAGGTIELVGADGQVVKLAGERAAEFLRRSDALAERYAAAHDSAAGERAAAIAAVEAEYRSLYAEFGADFDAVLAAPDSGGNSVGSEQAAGSLWDTTALGEQYADLGQVSPQPAGGAGGATAGDSASPGTAAAQAAPGAPVRGPGGNSVGSEQAAESLWDTTALGEQYADLGQITPQPLDWDGGAMTDSAAPAAPAGMADGAAAKVTDELATLAGLVATMGAEIPELPDAEAAPFNARLDRILAQHASADAAGKARLDAQARAAIAEYALAAITHAGAQTPEASRASAFLTSLAAVHTRHAATLAAGAPPASPPAGLDALYAEYGLRHAPTADPGDAGGAEETIEFVGAGGQAVTITGERAAEFLRRSDDISARYADALDAAPSASRDSRVAAIEAEHDALLAEYGISTEQPARGAQDAETVEFTSAGGQTVRLDGERAEAFLARVDDIGARYSAAYASAESPSRTATLAALEAEHDSLLAEFGLDSGQPAAADKAEGAAPQGDGDEPATR